MPKKISVKELLDNFDFHVLNKGKPNSRYIKTSGIARIGIELATNIKLKHKNQSNPVCFGESELNYFNQCSPAEIKLVVKRVKSLNPPMIILNSSFKPADIKNFLTMFGKTDITIASINLTSAEIYFEISPWIARKIAPTSIVHATLMSIYGIGVLITGDSGTGKSEAAMELLKNGRMFVGDDGIEVYNFGNALYGRPTDIAKQYMEVRGLGILDVSQMFGWQKIVNEIHVKMIVHLVNPDINKKKLNAFDRLGNQQETEVIRGVSLPKYYIPVTAGRPTASLIESAVVHFKLKQAGYNSAEKYLENYEKILEKGDNNA